MKLSIIIPTIGRSTLREVLEGIVNSQNFITIHPEIIVVRDAVEGPLFTELEKEFPQVIFIATKEKSYAGGARNLGIEKATGEVIVFLGDDTIPEKEWLERISDFHKTNKSKKRDTFRNFSFKHTLSSLYFQNYFLTYKQNLLS